LCVRNSVVAISLPWKDLAGCVSKSIRQLTGLRRLSIHDNTITGQIPATLGFVPDLRSVYLCDVPPLNKDDQS
jgi:hypothetical protein